MNKYRFAGYRLLEFSLSSKSSLQEVAGILLPHTQNILDGWISLQCEAWEPPNFTREGLRDIFGEVLDKLLTCMSRRELEVCIAELEDMGVTLARLQFPYEALIMSLHFLEESYMPILLRRPIDRTRLLIAMDEFLHAALAAIATAYFDYFRKELFDQAEVGRIVQESLLADIPRSCADLDIASIYISAAERAQLGGDFLDFFEIGPDLVAFVIGDLSGHGIEAAADSLTLRALFRGFTREELNIGSAMCRLNRVVDAELGPDQFATALAITYGPPGKLTLVNAGHPSPVLGNPEAALLELPGMALAINTSCTYQAREAKLEPGGVLVAYTDGVIEARSGGRLFGERRVLELVEEMIDAPPRAIAERIVDEALRHAGGKFPDDVAMLVVKRRLSSEK